MCCPVWNVSAHKSLHKEGELHGDARTVGRRGAATSPAEKRRLRDALDRELQSAPTYRTHERERAWVEAKRDEYLGQWLALDGDKLLAH